MTTTNPAPFSRSPHLVELIAEAERLATRVSSAPADDRATLQPTLDAQSALASLQLDGSLATEPPDVEGLDDIDALADAVATGDHARAERHAGSWFSVMRTLDEPPDEELLALEYLGALAGLRSDDLGEQLLTDPIPALQALHGRMTRGLVAPERAGRPRNVDQAIHDGTSGRVIAQLPNPEVVAEELARLGAWLASTGSREHGIVVAGVLHLEVLRIHPFDAANGRVARAASRQILRVRGLDPAGGAVLEPALARDRLGYHEEVARTQHRRDLTIWLERWAEAVTDGLRATAQQLGVLGDAAVPDRAAAFVAERTDPAFTVADYRAEASAPADKARSELSSLLDAGLVVRVPGTRGLRFRVDDTGSHSSSAAK